MGAGRTAPAAVARSVKVLIVATVVTGTMDVIVRSEISDSTSSRRSALVWICWSIPLEPASKFVAIKWAVFASLGRFVPVLIVPADMRVVLDCHCTGKGSHTGCNQKFHTVLKLIIAQVSKRRIYLLATLF